MSLRMLVIDRMQDRRSVQYRYSVDGLSFKLTIKLESSKVLKR